MMKPKETLSGWMQVMRPPLLILMLACGFLGGCDSGIFAAKRDEARLEWLDRSIMQGNYEAALRESKSYTTDFPEDGEGWCLRGWAHAKVDELGEADACFDKALALDSEMDNAYVGRGVVCRKKGDLAGARAAYAEAIRITPENAEAYSSLMVIELLEGNHQKAADYGEEAWALRKDLASIPANLAIVYHYLGEEAKKQIYYDEARHLNYHSMDAVDEIFAGTRVLEQP